MRDSRLAHGTVRLIWWCAMWRRRRGNAAARTHLPASRCERNSRCERDRRSCSRVERIAAYASSDTCGLGWRHRSRLALVRDSSKPAALSARSGGFGRHLVCVHVFSAGGANILYRGVRAERYGMRCERMRRRELHDAIRVITGASNPRLIDLLRTLSVLSLRETHLVIPIRS